MCSSASAVSATCLRARARVGTVLHRKAGHDSAALVARAALFVIRRRPCRAPRRRAAADDARGARRAILGSIERFFGVLTESYAGAFPCWLAPVQCRLLPVNTASEQFCRDLVQRMKRAGIRAQIAVGEKVGKAIRNAEIDKVPVVCVVGARDIEAGVLSVRTYAAGELGTMAVDDVVGRLQRCNTERKDF